jgi:hypothetical protein
VLIVLAAYYIIHEPIYLHASRVPDEIWYFQLAHERVPNGSAAELFHAFAVETNRLGYGALYWNLYSTMIYLGGKDALFSMRILCLSMNALVGWLIYVAGVRRRCQFAELAAILWFVLPAAWWSGKVTGPEMLSVLFAVASITVLSGTPSQRGILASFVLLGMSIGVKLNAAPLALFAFILYRPQSAAGIVKACGALVAGFAAANPFVLWSPSGFLAELAKTTMPPARTWAFLENIFSNSVWEWDGVLSGGLLQWTFPIVGWALLLAICWYFRIQKRFLAAAVSAFVCWTVMFNLNGRFLGWDWFPCIALIPFSLLYLDRDESSIWRRALPVVVLGLLAAPLSYTQYQQALWRNSNVDAMPSVFACVQNHVSGRDVGQVVDYTEIFEADFRALHPSLYEPGRVIASHQSFAWLTSSPRRAFANGTLVLIGDRLRMLKGLGNAAQTLFERRVAMGYSEVTVLGRCGFVEVVYLR